ncbi:hypothetical protein F7P63_09610 [Campylobacter coli]|uniref:hypothetical protein n=1 Tax=Campylobacter coli TaxID=195 RepID=UPI00042E378D|nr:hypothetical protein [Campylobacter coli]AHK74245.1 hypothetical protein YSQ_09965 [Campylobacter coli RM1875]EAK0327840.1 hypothetical protein [Campylobacter coli]ECR2994864.1 hypothetical protein [Campylobacter coli]KAB0616334.1 hypothetical protein F7P63_09610 [Campylobacter coli]MBX1663563.1 hypothetical protein [Campylobacter coli]
MNLLNKKIILVYVIYISIIALIYFFGKDFLLVFDKNPAYYMLILPISMFFVFIVISFLEKRGINGVLVYLLTVIPLLFLFFHYSDAKLSVDYLKSEAMFIIFLILLSSLIAPVAIYEMFREKEEVEG